MKPLHPTLQAITARIEARSAQSRQSYLAVLDKAQRPGPYRSGLGCANAAHVRVATLHWLLDQKSSAWTISPVDSIHASMDLARSL